MTSKTFKCAWRSRTATVQARTESAARNKARKVWGITVVRPADSEIMVEVLA